MAAPLITIAGVSATARPLASLDASHPNTNVWVTMMTVTKQNA